MQICEPLGSFAIESGLSVGEVCGILRGAVVKAVSNRQLETTERINISGIAATTGITRSEISRILKDNKSKHKQLAATRQQSANRVLSAWHEQPKFINANGEPAELKIYGRGQSFDQLVKEHGRGIPTRAMLDELIRARAAVLLPSQRVRAKSLFAIKTGINPQMIKAFGQHVAELMETLIWNMRLPARPVFVASVSGGAEQLSVLRREISRKSEGFLENVKEGLSHSNSKSLARGSRQVSVTVFVHESGDGPEVSTPMLSRRRNFSRRS